MAPKASLPTTLPLVAVVWNDAHASSAELIDQASIVESHKPKEVITLGWLMREDEAGVSVCAEYVAELGYRGHTFVPRSLVKQIIILKKPK